MPIRVLHLSDIHLAADPAMELLGVNTEDSFHAVFNQVSQYQDMMDLVIITGDLSHDGSAESYKRLAEKLSQFNLPVYFLPGNHDNQKTMSEVYPLGMFSDSRQLIFQNWQFILLDSQIPGSTEGRLDPSQLRFMQTCLTMNPEHYTALFFHHHPVMSGSKWLDPQALQNTDELFEILAVYPQVKHIVFGHVHQILEITYQDIQCSSSPSTCIQFKPNSPEFVLDHVPPGYRWLHFYSDGNVETNVERVTEYIGHFEPDATGY